MTDVLAVIRERWEISSGAATPWTFNFNPSVGAELSGVEIVNMDATDNIDDVLRLDPGIPDDLGRVNEESTMTWLRSQNGTSSLDVWQSLTNGTFGFAGRFGAAPGGATMIIDRERFGHFHGIEHGVPTEWSSTFPY